MLHRATNAFILQLKTSQIKDVFVTTVSLKSEGLMSLYCVTMR